MSSISNEAGCECREQSNTGRLPTADALLPHEGADEDEPALEILIVHEDLPTGLRAKQALDRLGLDPGVKLHFVVRLWTFRMLQDSLLLKHAIDDASNAQILFLSLHGHQELPPVARELIEHWLAGQKEHPIALVVSLDESLRDSAVATELLNNLRAKADASGVDLFPHFSAPPTVGWNWATPDVPFHDDAMQTALGLPSHNRNWRNSDSVSNRLGGCAQRRANSSSVLTATQC